MADMLSLVRGFIVAEAEKRKREIEWHGTRSSWHHLGKPNADQIARRMGVSKPTITRILNGNPHRRPGVLRHRVEEWQPSQVLLAGLMRWTNINSMDDLWTAILNTNPAPPFPKKRGAPDRPRRKHPKPRKPTHR